MTRRAFTLIELLVVISIIVVLVGMIVPVMDNVRQQARSVACRSNIRQLQMACQAYEAANHTLPYGFDFMRRPGPVSGFPNSYPGTMTFDLPGWWWFNFAKVQAQSSSFKRQDGMPECPSKHLMDPKMEWDNLWGNYGANRALFTSGKDDAPFKSAYERPAVSTSMLRQPGATLMILDSGYALICWWQATSDPPVKLSNASAETAYVPGLDINKDRLLQPGQIPDAIGGRHPKKTINVGFADGHSEQKKARDLLVEKIDPNTYANKTPLWEPR